jgi:hypothetical protein
LIIVIDWQQTFAMVDTKVYHSDTLFSKYLRTYRGRLMNFTAATLTVGMFMTIFIGGPISSILP